MINHYEHKIGATTVVVALIRNRVTYVAKAGDTGELRERTFGTKEEAMAVFAAMNHHLRDRAATMRA